MQQHSDQFPIDKMAKEFKVSRSGYYKFVNKKASATTKENLELIKEISLIHKKSNYVYGSPRVHAVLKKKGKKCSRKRVAKLMRQNGIKAKTIKKWKATTKGSKDMSKIAPNVLDQNFTVTLANKVWVQDITYIPTNEGWLYLSAVLDLYSRKIVGLSMGSRIDTNLVTKSLYQALTHRKPGPGLILHSDRGVQYTSSEYKKIANDNQLLISMSAKGNCYDNAVMESFFHTLKTEHVFFCDYKTRNEAMVSIFEYIEIFYNRQRIHSTINFMSPDEYENIKSTKLDESR